MNRKSVFWMVLFILMVRLIIVSLNFVTSQNTQIAQSMMGSIVK